MPNAQVSFFRTHASRVRYHLSGGSLESAPVPPPRPWDAPQAAGTGSSTRPPNEADGARNRNADCQPHCSPSTAPPESWHTAPMLAPELKMPVAVPRCRLGNHSATVLMQAGKFAASPSPSKRRATPKVNAVVAARVRHRRDAPQPHRDRKTDARAELVQQPARAQQPDPVSHRKRRRDAAVLVRGPADLDFQRLRQHAQDLAVHVADRGREKEERAHGPAEVRARRARRDSR